MKYLKKLMFLRYSSFGKLNQLEICFPVVYSLLRFGEKKYAQKSPDVNVLVISRDGSLKVFNKNELKNILTKFHDFIINLQYLELSSVTNTNSLGFM